MTQLERVEKALRTHGRLNTLDFQRPPIIDGGVPILRLAARVHQGKVEHGWRVRTHRKMNGTVDYEWLGVDADQASGADAETAAGHVGSAVGAPVSLFDPPPAVPKSGVLEDFEAA